MSSLKHSLCTAVPLTEIVCFSQLNEHGIDFVHAKLDAIFCTFCCCIELLVEVVSFLFELDNVISFDNVLTLSPFNIIGTHCLDFPSMTLFDSARWRIPLEFC